MQLRVEELPEKHVFAGGDPAAGAGEEAGGEEKQTQDCGATR